MQTALFVVICFQFLLLRSLTTTILYPLVATWLLWFAFNFYYYDLWQQLRYNEFGHPYSCDLLSIFIITIFDNNKFLTMKFHRVVVICFQFLLLRSLTTTSNRQEERLYGCDLLSIFIITIFDNNSYQSQALQHPVVICFQFLLLRSLTTTIHPK